MMVRSFCTVNDSCKSPKVCPRDIPMIPRTLEPEAMDTPEEVRDYDAMDHATVNARFVAEFLDAHGPCRGGELLDVGTGPARIPIALCRADRSARVLGIDLAEAMLELRPEQRRRGGPVRPDPLRPGRCPGPLLPQRPFRGGPQQLDHPPPRRPRSRPGRDGPRGRSRRHAFRPRPGQARRPRDARSPRHHLRRRRGPRRAALFEASLHAALTLREVRDIVRTLGRSDADVVMTSDRHWTWSWHRPGL